MAEITGLGTDLVLLIIAVIIVVIAIVVAYQLWKNKKKSYTTAYAN